MDASIFPAARVADPICHSPAIDGFWKGSFAGAFGFVAIGIFIAGTGGLGAVGIAVFAATGAVAGGFGGEVFARVFMDGIKTGNLTNGAPNVFVNGRAIVRMSDPVTPCWTPIEYAHGQTAMAEGSTTVLINCKPAARVADETICGAYVSEGSDNVMIGGPKGRAYGTTSSAVGSAVSWFLERAGIATFAAQTAIYPISGALTLLGLGAYHASYNVYNSINAAISAVLFFQYHIEIPLRGLGSRLTQALH